VTAENPAKTTKPTNSKVPFGVRSHVLDESSDPLRDWQFLREGELHLQANCKVWGISAVLSIFSTVFSRWQQ